MANNEEHQVKEAFEAIHLPEDIAARALESIEAKREQRESERTEGLLTAQENAHAKANHSIYNAEKQAYAPEKPPSPVAPASPKLPE